MFQTNIEGQAGLTYPIFPVPIINTKETCEIEYDIQYLLVSYHQNASNSCSLISVVSAFTASGENNYTRDIEIKIEE